MQGNFVVKNSNSENQFPIDQAQENINKVGKTAGGLVGITRVEGALDKLCLTYNERENLSDDTRAMFVFRVRLMIMNTKKFKYRDCSMRRRSVSGFVSAADVPAFKMDVPLLMSLVSSDAVPDALQEAILHTQTHGTQLVANFVEARLSSSSFYDSLPRNNMFTFASMFNVKVNGDCIKTNQCGIWILF